MIYLLDTNVIIAAMNNRPIIVGTRMIGAIGRGYKIATSSITVFELYFGVAASRRRSENMLTLQAFLSGAIEVHPFLDEDAKIAGNIRADLKSLGTPIGPYDLLIAAQALRLDATLVTANTREFGRVPDLKLEDWTQPA